MIQGDNEAGQVKRHAIDQAKSVAREASEIRARRGGGHLDLQPRDDFAKRGANPTFRQTAVGEEECDGKQATPPCSNDGRKRSEPDGVERDENGSVDEGRKGARAERGQRR